jgi:urease accessory protein
MTAVGIFATFHGYAHGTEVPETAQPFLYALGFLTGTALIHILGVVIGDIARHYEQGKLFLRGGGAVVAFIGVLFAIGVI